MRPKLLILLIALLSLSPLSLWGQVLSLTTRGASPLIIATIDDQPDSGGGNCTINNSFCWEWNHDAGTPGSISSMASELNTSISLDGQSREFDITNAQSGAGFIAHIYLGSTNLPCSATQFTGQWGAQFSDTSRLVNFEFDIYHQYCYGTVAGETIIMSVQCATGDGKWEITYLDGSGNAHWSQTDQACTHTPWTANAWHTIKTLVSHDNLGNVHYYGASLDGTFTPFTCSSAPCILSSAHNIGFSPNGLLLMNFQQDMDSSSTNYSWTDYLDVNQLTVTGN